MTAWAYDNRGNLLSARYPGNVTDTYEYDVLNRVIFKSEQGVENRFAYNANHQVIAMTNGETVDTVYAYDGLGRLVEKMQGLNTSDQATSAFGYDANSNLVFVTNALGKTVFYKYDGLNRRILETKPSDISTSGLDKDNIDYAGFTAFKTVTYDAVSNVKEIKKADSSKIAYVYDNMERTTQVKHNSVIRQEFAYDALSRMIWSSDNNRGLSTHDVFYDHYNLLNINTSETQNTRTVETAYDNNANLTGILYPSGKALARAYNAVNLLESVTNTHPNPLPCPDDGIQRPWQHQTDDPRQRDFFGL